jgi:hypothetical protein
MLFSKVAKGQVSSESMLSFLAVARSLEREDAQQHELSYDNEGICTTGFSVSHTLEEGRCPSRENKEPNRHSSLSRPKILHFIRISYRDSPLQSGILLLPLGRHSLCSFSLGVSHSLVFDLSTTLPVWRVKESCTIFFSKTSCNARARPISDR